MDQSKHGRGIILCRAVPFSREQWDELFRIAEKGGYSPVLLGDDEEPDTGTLGECVAMLGAFPPEWLARTRGLAWLQASSAGVERYLKALPAGSVLTNASGSFGVTIAEHMIACLLMIYRRMPLYMEHQRERLWRTESANRTLKGAVITIVGLGDLGETFARRVRAFGVFIRGVKRAAGDPPDFVDECYAVSDIDSALRGADVIALCVPDTPETRGLLSAERIGELKPGAVVINVGRGSAIDEPALTVALSEGKLGGAVLDVFEREPLPPDNPLWELDNVIITPHVSGRDHDPHNLAIIFNLFRDNLTRFTRGELLTNVVDRDRGY